MKHNIMLVHMGDKPDSYLHITMALESMGFFVFDKENKFIQDFLPDYIKNPVEMVRRKKQRSKWGFMILHVCN